MAPIEASRARKPVTVSSTARGGNAAPALLKCSTLATPGVSNRSDATSRVVCLMDTGRIVMTASWHPQQVTLLRQVTPIPGSTQSHEISELCSPRGSAIVVLSGRRGGPAGRSPRTGRRVSALRHGSQTSVDFT